MATYKVQTVQGPTFYASGFDRDPRSEDETFMFYDVLDSENLYVDSDSIVSISVETDAPKPLAKEAAYEIAALSENWIGKVFVPDAENPMLEFEDPAEHGADSWCAECGSIYSGENDGYSVENVTCEKHSSEK